MNPLERNYGTFFELNISAQLGSKFLEFDLSLISMDSIKFEISSFLGSGSSKLLCTCWDLGFMRPYLYKNHTALTMFWYQV